MVRLRVQRALHWTRLSCKRSVSNQVRLGLFVLAYNLGFFAGEPRRCPERRDGNGQ